MRTSCILAEMAFAAALADGRVMYWSASTSLSSVSLSMGIGFGPTPALTTERACVSFLKTYFGCIAPTSSLEQLISRVMLWSDARLVRQEVNSGGNAALARTGRQTAEIRFLRRTLNTSLRSSACTDEAHEMSG